MRFRNEIAPLIGGSNGANQKSKCLGGHPNNSDLATAQSRIRFLGQNLIEAYQNGDRAAAIKFQQAMATAIKCQPETVKAARLREIDAAIAASDEFYFMDAGDRDRARLGGAK